MLDLFKSKTKDIDEAEDKFLENLEFLEKVLAEEDPEFVKEISQLKIDDDKVHQSVIEQAVNIELEQKSFIYNLKMALKKPFQFKAHPKKAISFWLITLALVGVVIWLTKTSIWFHRSKLFLTSYAEWGLELHDFNLNEDSEYFFDNPKISRNIITLSRMMTNLLPSENSSSNPMVIMELSLEGVSAESVIEMKDREAEFKDMFLRLVEEFSYDDLEAAQGKQKLADLVLIKANENLTRGQVRKVFYKSFIIKP